MMDELKRIVGDRAYKYLRRGGLLRIWRRSSPHNWFIETKSETLWHSNDGCPRPNICLFKLIDNSDATICNYWGGDSGMSELSMYKLIK